MTASGSPPDAHIASNTALAARPETVPSATRRTSLPSCPAPTRASPTGSPSRLSAPASSPLTQFAASRAVSAEPEPAASTAASK